MKLIIDVPDDIYNMVVNDYPLSKMGKAAIFDAICDGIPLPDNITNGDVIKMLFPNAEIYNGSGSYVNVLFGNSVVLEDVYGEWWNAPYKEGVSK